jgi:polar amino acid transport system substrate-binding protein
VAEGFDVDMANMVAKSLGVKLELTQITGANRIPFLLTDKVDVVISVMGLTPERARQIMFTAPYANTSLAVYGPKSLDIKSAADFAKLKVAAAKGTTQELALSAANPRASIMRTEDDATAAAAYLSGQADLFATNSIVAIDLAKKNPKTQVSWQNVIRKHAAVLHNVQIDRITLQMIGDKALFHGGIHPAVDAADALHEADRVPVDVVVDHLRGVLEVEAFRKDVCTDKYADLLVAGRRKFGRRLAVVVGGEALEQLHSILLGAAVDLFEAGDTAHLKLLEEVFRGVSEFAEDEHLLALEVLWIQ